MRRFVPKLCVKYVVTKSCFSSGFLYFALVKNGNLLYFSWILCVKRGFGRVEYVLFGAFFGKAIVFGFFWFPVLLFFGLFVLVFCVFCHVFA